MKQKHYIAVIADIIGSREAGERPALQKRLRAAVAAANDAFEESIASRFVVTLGDEFQGLLKDPDNVSQLLARCHIELYPSQVRFGVGMGRLDTPLEPQALGMDGPCFHRGRDAVKRAASRKTHVEVSVTGDSGDQGVFDVYAVLSAALRRRWTKRQSQVVDLTMAGLEGKEVAVRLSITPSAVSQHLHAAGGPALIEATRAWQGALRHSFLQLT